MAKRRSHNERVILSSHRMLKKAKEEIARLAALVEDSEDAILGETLDGIVTYWNGAAHRLYGYTAEEVVGVPISILVPPDRHDEMAQILERIKQGERIEHFETVRVRKDGTPVDVAVSISPIRDAAGTITGASTIARDITARKRAEEELRESERDARSYAESIVETVREPLLILYPDLRVKSANRAFYRTFQGSPEETENWFLHEIESGQWDIPTLREALAGVLAHDTSFEDVEVARDFPRIGRRTLLLNARRLAQEDDRVHLILLAMADVTERKRAEQFREEYLSLIAHDLRSPLTVVMGMADWLRRHLTGQGEEAAARIFTSAQRMESMIRDLVASARLEAGQLAMHEEPTDLLELLAELCKRIGTDEDLARIQVTADQTMPPVRADPRQIERAITNLVANALKYSPADSPVVVRVDRSDSEARISVTDQGVGIPASEIPHLFERFYRARTAGQYEGIGLGLYITRLIVQAHSGRIWVDSEEGKGTTFHFTLPLV